MKNMSKLFERLKTIDLIGKDDTNKDICFTVKRLIVIEMK